MIVIISVSSARLNTAGMVPVHLRWGEVLNFNNPFQNNAAFLDSTAAIQLCPPSVALPTYTVTGQLHLNCSGSGLAKHLGLHGVMFDMGFFDLLGLL